jgi:LysR family transcriptional regulator, cell division regulator
MISRSEDVEYFVAVAETGNISRAAEKLGVRQPTLTQALKRLEDSLGVPLFVRQRVGVQLTRAGAAFLENSQRLLDVWKETAQVTVSSEHDVQGHFTIGCHPAVALYSLDRFIPKLMSDHPLLNFDFVHDLSRNIVEQIIRFKVDIGIVINPVRHPDLVLIKIDDDKVSFFKTARGSSDVLLYDPDLLQSQFLLKTLKNKIKFGRMVATRELDVIANLASNHCGVGLLPGNVAKRYENLQKMTALPSFDDELYVSYRADMQTSRSAKIIVEAIKNSFR